jgi:hypothetical protein
MTLRMSSIGDLYSMSAKEAIAAVCGPPVDKKMQFTHTDIVKQNPMICKFVVANPKAFLDPANRALAEARGFNTASVDPSFPATDLARLLPVCYLVDVHQEYGMLGLRLNAPRQDLNMGDLHPELKSFRDRPVYSGGLDNSGSSFLMVHRKQGFPDNRVWAGVPDKPEFKFFFSPDLAMANELCLTNDARYVKHILFSLPTV